MRIDRMLAITILLLNREKISAKELAEKYGVSVRTIYRDIDALNLAGIPVISYPGINGGFGLVSNYKIDRQLITFEEMKSLLTALKGVNTALRDISIETLIEKVSSIVPENKRELMVTHLDRFSMDFSPWGTGSEKTENLEILQKAVKDSEIISFSYFSNKYESTQRSVRPLNLFYRGYSWYLFGWCMLKNDYRIFKAGRIRELSLTGNIFREKYLSYSRYISLKKEKQEVRTITLTLKFSPEIKVKAEEYFPPSSLVPDKEGYLTAETDFPEDEWVYSLILSFGEFVEVIKPEYIRNIIREKAQKISEIYS